MTQDEALDILKMGYNVFLTGPAGSGKTYVLNKYLEYLREHDVETGITASTGIAATHIGGMTIHSWAGIGIKDNLTEKEFRMLVQDPRLAKRLQKAKVLVIDEVSMLHHFRLDLVDQVLRMARGELRPFGGLQVILVGDFFQLPPVARGGEVAHFVHRSNAWATAGIRVCYLEEQYRQEDERFLRVLNDIRGARVSEETLKPLRERYRREIRLPVTPTKLYVHNVDVDAVNERELDLIRDKEKTYESEYHGRQKLLESLKKSVLAPETLRVKVGAAVMFVKNNFEAGYVNGTLGEVVAFEGGYPVVKTASGKRIIANPENWAYEDMSGNEANVMQVPLRLAWAITVHKSQGMSLDAAEIDLSRSFLPGMGYVALSRVRSLEGLRLMGMNDMALRVNEEVLVLDEELHDLSKKAREGLKTLSLEEKKELQEDFLRKIGGDAEKKLKTPQEKRSKKEKERKEKAGEGKTFSVEALREKHPQAYKKWEREEEERLVEEFGRGKNMGELAVLFGRKVGGIRSRLMKLGLLEDVE